MNAAFRAALTNWRQAADNLATTRITYAHSRAAAILAATGKNAEARDAEATIATICERAAVEAAEVAEAAAKYELRYLLAVAGGELQSEAA